MKFNSAVLELLHTDGHNDSNRHHTEMRSRLKMRILQVERTITHNIAVSNRYYSEVFFSME